jgi:hypothetical protein
MWHVTTSPSLSQSGGLRKHPTSLRVSDVDSVSVVLALTVSTFRHLLSLLLPLLLLAARTPPGAKLCIS